MDAILPGDDYNLNTPPVRQNKAKLESILKYVSSGITIVLIRRHPHLAKHIKILVFKHPPPSRIQKYRDVDAAERDSERMQVWNLAALLLGLCIKVEALDWQLCYGIQGELWTVGTRLVSRAEADEQAISLAGTLRKLVLDYPDLSDYPCITTTNFARVSPELQAIESESENPLYSTVAGDSKSWTLGAGWQGLELMKLAGLSQNGVSCQSLHQLGDTAEAQAKTLSNHLQHFITAPAEGRARMTSLDLSTHFLDLALLTSIGQYGALGSLKHLTLATSGTRLTADGVQAALEGCVALESFTLKDGEGKLILVYLRNIRLTVRTFRQDDLGSGRVLACNPTEHDDRDRRKRRSPLLGPPPLDLDPQYTLCPTGDVPSQAIDSPKSFAPVSDRHDRYPGRPKGPRARSDPSNVARGDNGGRSRYQDA